jgi:hypothetical protein
MLWCALCPACSVCSWRGLMCSLGRPWRGATLGHYRGDAEFMRLIGACGHKPPSAPIAPFSSLGQISRATGGRMPSNPPLLVLLLVVPAQTRALSSSLPTGASPLEIGLVVFRFCAHKSCLLCVLEEACPSKPQPASLPRPTCFLTCFPAHHLVAQESVWSWLLVQPNRPATPVLHATSCDSCLVSAILPMP